MAIIHLEARLNDGNEIWRADAPFGEALAVLNRKEESENYQAIEVPISTSQLAIARMQFPTDHSLNQNGSYTRESFLYARNGFPLLDRDSPFQDADLARKAIEANRTGKYFITEDRTLYEKRLEVAEREEKEDVPFKKRKVIILPSREKFNISSSGNWRVYNFMIEDKQYLKHVEQNSLLVDLVDTKIVDSQTGTLVTQTWFHSLLDDSDVDGDNRHMYCNLRVRGVFSITSEARAQKNLGPATDRKESEPLSYTQELEEEL